MITISNIVQHLRVEHDSRYLENLVEQVLMYLPVMKVMRGGDLMAAVLVNLADFTLLSSGDTFADLFLLLFRLGLRLMLLNLRPDM